jgi:hypothetical protein
MARYKEYSYEQGQLIPISFQAQIVPGSFEWALVGVCQHLAFSGSLFFRNTFTKLAWLKLVGLSLTNQAQRYKLFIPS